jgi:uncharacterized membrane protein
VDQHGDGADEAPRPTDDDVEELLEDLEDLESVVDSDEGRRVVQHTIDTLTRLSSGRVFGVDDLAQQIVGGFILSAPFVVTEEVWTLAATMNWIQWLITVCMVLAIGYGTLYQADDDRDAEREESIAGLPLRFVSLILISYLSVTTLAFVFAAPETFGAAPWTTVKSVSIGAIFSVVGAATADSLFG